MPHSLSPRSALRFLRFAVLPFVVIGVTFLLGFLFHIRGQQVVETQLRERMLNVVAISAPHFDGEQLRAIRGIDDVDTQAYRDAVATLQNIRSMSPHVRFAYIMRRTDDPTMLAFVADADAALTDAQLDVNDNGVVDTNEEAALPGDLYPIETNDTLQTEAFERPVVDDNLTEDQWGRLVSAYAPIRGSNGEVVAVLGIDIEASEFFAMTRGTFSMVAVLLVTLVGALVAAYILIVIRKRRMEAMRQLDIERTALVDLAMHQLGMPLATVRWWVELLKEGKGKSISRDAIAQLEEGVERMSKVLNAMSDVTQLREDKLDYHPVKISLSTLIKRAVAETASQLKDRGQTVRVKKERNLPSVLLDSKLFVGILHELIQNASFYSPDGTEIEVRARRDGRMIALEVSDRGHGIPEQDLPYIFEKFRRGSNAARFRPVGNGLGLYITKRVIDKSKGRIRIASILNEGTTVSIFLPVAD